METPGDVTHDNDESGNRVAPAGDPCGVVVGCSPETFRVQLPEHGFGKEPKLEKGFGQIPDAIKVKMTENCSWHLAADSIRKETSNPNAGT